MPARSKSFFGEHPLVRLFVVHTVIGFALASAFVAILMAFDAAGLRTLILETHAGWVVALLWFFSGLTFASAQMGIAVMSMGDDRD